MACVGELPPEALLRVLEAMNERVVVLRRTDSADPESLIFVWANYEWDPDNELHVDELLGRRLVDAFPRVRETALLPAYAEALDTQLSVGVPEVRYGDARLPDRVYQIQAVPLAEDLVASVVHDLTPERRAQAALQILNRDLETRILYATANVRAANEELESFAYSVSHDLRAPLRAMTGFAQYLVESYADQLEGEPRYLLGRIQSAAVRMGNLIDALLQLSRLTRQPLSRERIDLRVLCEEIVASLAEAEPARKCELEVEDISIVADPDLTRVLLVNLLGNAWKFSSDRRITRITVRRVANGCIQILDNGEGFDPAYADQLFRPFGRLHEADQYDGMGIGLAIVDRIVKRHGGRIAAEGTPGKGASFTWTLDA